ncbi:thy-1 membrane glycoprotein isoform X2 [Salmo salar]|uniref:Thy-1 membrane glycoprotein isoform X2 n=1 Tax=Salmo salar TaxID=8030 RepID=A0ABM3EQZ4_SALSA|nr:thy-1 membrane glycoprotein-like isoform X2 [Salmo salar]
MFGFQRTQQQFRCTSSIMRSLLVCGVVLGVLWNVVHCELVSVCEEEDGDLRVDCHVEPRANQINSYEFSVSTGTVETVVNTNVSGSAPDVHYRDRSYVEHLEPYGYRLTLNADTHTHTLTNTHTTFICKISKNIASVIIEKNDLLPCSADSVLVQSCYWLLGVLLSLWGLPPQ